MSDTEHTEHTEHIETPSTEKLRYMGGTTRHDGPGDEPQSLPAVDSDELGIENIQPGVGTAQENTSPKE
jgi:hypothetical protein